MRSVRVLAVLVALLLPFLPAPTASADEPGVVLEGSIEAGRKAIAVATAADGEFSYSWTLDGVETISRQVPWGAVLPSNEFMLLEDHVGKELAVTVTITPSSGEPVSVSSGGVVVASGAVVTNPPVVSGKPLIGETLTVDANLLYPVDGVTLSYQWRASGVGKIPGATGSALKVTQDLWLHSVWVEVTARKPGWRDSVRVSRSDANIVLPPTIETGSLSFDNVPRAGEHVSYQGWEQRYYETDTVEWLLDGKVVSRVGNGQLLVKDEWVGKSLVARVTRSRALVPSVTVSTRPATVQPRVQVLPLRVKVVQHVVGWTAQVQGLEVRPGHRATVTWYRRDSAGRETNIPGATGLVYRFSKADLGHSVGVRVTVEGPTGHTLQTFEHYVARPAFNLYTTPGEHTVNDRQWRTTCEVYSQTQRCRTDIIATQVINVDGRWTQRTGWVFNNLTYLPMPAPHTWGPNRLARTNEWTDGNGRQWRTDCDPETVGNNTCRTYITAHVTQAHLRPGGGWTYETTKQWVFNNMLYFE